MKTYIQARAAILAHLATLHGWVVKPHLKVPQAILPSGDKLFFKTQAVYLNDHSLWVDIRSISPEGFAEYVMVTLQERRSL